MRIRNTPALRAVTALWRHQAAAAGISFDFDNILGTSLEVARVVVADAAVAMRAEQVLLEEIDRLTDILSTYSPASELTGWQVRQEPRRSRLHRELAEVPAPAESWRVRTNGGVRPGGPRRGAGAYDNDSGRGVRRAPIAGKHRESVVVSRS